MRIRTDHAQKKRCVVPRGIFQTMSCSDDKQTFCLPKLAPSLCFLASEAGKVLWCLPCTRIAGRESCEVAAPGEQQGCSPAQARLFCTSQKSWGNGAKARAELAPTTSWHWAREPERARARCCLGGARAAGKKVAEGAQRSSGKGPCSVLQRKAKNSWGHLLAHGGGKKSLPPPQLQGIRGHPGGARKPGSNLAQRDKRSRDKWSCSMLQRKAKNPRGPVPMCPRGKFLPDPSAGDRLFPEHGSKTWLLVQQAVHASQKVPKSYSPSSCSDLKGFQEWPLAPGLMDLGGKNPSHAWRDTSRCSKALGAPATSLHPLSYGCCAWLCRGGGWRALQCSSSAPPEGIALVLSLALVVLVTS